MRQLWAKPDALTPVRLEMAIYILYGGSNMAATRIQSMPDIIKAKKEGKRVILIEVYAEA